MMYIMVADGEFGLTAIVNAVSALTGVVVPVETSFTKIVVGLPGFLLSWSIPLHHGMGS